MPPVSCLQEPFGGSARSAALHLWTAALQAAPRRELGWGEGGGKTPSLSKQAPLGESHSENLKDKRIFYKSIRPGLGR